MIITRTPFRVSFVGGGTDLKEFYAKNGVGAVVSVAIKKYMYIVIHPYFHDKIRIKYSQTEDVNDLDAIKHPVVRECLKRVGVNKSIEIASFADVPSGTGLGSSSAFAVGLLNALYAYKGKTISKNRLAAEACQIEIDVLKEPIGKQDQYATAFGNINYIRFNRNESVDVSPLLLTESVKDRLENVFCLYYIGGQRKAKSILSEQKANIVNQQTVFNHLKDLLGLTDDLKTAITGQKIDAIGSILHKGWAIKKQLASGISNTHIDRIYQTAMENGAKGGKLLGAGGTGFLLIGHDDHKRLSKCLGCKMLPFRIDREGTKIIFYE